MTNSGEGAATETPATPAATPQPASVGAATADRVRQTAQRLTTGVGATAAVLLGSLKLSHIGELQGSQLTFGLIGVALGMIGAFGAMAASARVLSPIAVTLADLNSDAELLDAANKPGSGWLSGFDNVEDITNHYTQAAADRVKAHLDYINATRDGNDEAANAARNAEVVAEARLTLVNPAVQRLIDRAAAFRMKALWEETALPWFFVSVVCAAVGIVLFALQSPPSKPTDAAVQQSPVRITLNFTDTGTKTYAERLGSNCDLDAVKGIALASDAKTVSVVVSDDKCEAVPLTLSSQDASWRTETS